MPKQADPLLHEAARPTGRWLWKDAPSVFFSRSVSTSSEDWPVQVHISRRREKTIQSTAGVSIFDARTLVPKWKTLSIDVPLADLTSRALEETAQAVRIHLLEQEMRLLRQELDSVSEGLRQIDRPRSFIASFSPEPYEVLREIPVVIEQIEGAFVASFLDANVNAVGDTTLDALDDLKATILDLFEMYSELPSERLGPAPARQLAVLREFIRPRQN